MKPEIYDKILESLPHHPEDKTGAPWHGFWVNGNDEIMCRTKEAANLIADFFEDCGFDIMHTYYYHDEADGLNREWWAVYIDGQ
jgi:hypothetical protein